MAKVLGIDLGTTNSCMAVIEGGEPSVIAIMNKTRIFSKTLQQLKTMSNEGVFTLPKKEHASPQSRDIREDRGERQMKTSKNSQSFPHVRGLKTKMG